MWLRSPTSKGGPSSWVGGTVQLSTLMARIMQKIQYIRLNATQDYTVSNLKPILVECELGASCSRVEYDFTLIQINFTLNQLSFISPASNSK